jgi:adenosylcobinamide kinase/adenosylcobinamide-phosphate guanylyltransferase
MTRPQIELVLGGARSGKSRYGEERLRPFARKIYVATAQGFDDEMTARIARHRVDRGPDWITVEEPLALAAVLDAHATAASAETAILIDCLTLWLTNVMLAGADIDAEAEALGAALTRARVPVVLVSNEVGLGLVPETPLGRAFRDAQGRLNQQIAKLATRVVFIAAGLPLVLKDQASAG